MLYQLSSEAAHWERGQLIEFISSREEWNDVKFIWNNSYMNCGSRWNFTSLRDQELGDSLLITCFCITGIYGHTAVYYPAKGIVLVFGGYRFRVHTVSASNELYSLDLATGKWNILQALPSNEVSPAKSWSNLPSAFNSKEKKNYLLCLSMSFFSTISYYFFLKNARWAKIFTSGLW